MYREKNSKDKTKIRNKLFVWCIVLALMAAIAVADVGQGPAEADLWANAGTAEIQTSSSRESVLPNGTIPVFNCEEDFGVRKALALLGSLCEKNIVPTPNVDGVLAFRQLTNVTFEEAMDAILGGKFEYEQKGNLIEVFPRGDESRMKYTIFALNYISAVEAERLIKPVLSSNGIVGVTSAAETGVPVGESISADTAGGDTMAMRDTIVVYDFAEKIADARRVIMAVDTRPKQVLVEATILSAVLTEGMELGVDLNLLAGVSLTGTSTTTQQQDSVVGGTVDITNNKQNVLEQIKAGVAGSALETAGFANVGGNGLRIGIRSGNLTAFITALETVTDITLLANPKILAVNKQLGQVYIGQKIGYREGNIVSQGGVVTEGQVKQHDTGTKLSFRPYIGDDGYIRMDIHAKDSIGNLNAVEAVDEDAAEVATNIMVKDGETIVIGGLFRDVITTTRQQIPLLGDLPLLGGLFRKNTDTTRRQEVIVLLTPHIIEDPSETEGQARMDDIGRKRFGAKEGLQWIGRARLVEDRYAKAAQYYVDGDAESAMKELEYVLELRPSYLEAIRLKEKIIAETNPDELDMIERILLGDIEREDSDKWQRR